MEVKGHQRSNGVNYALWLLYLVKRITDASYDDDPHRGQRSYGVKYSKLWSMATKRGQTISYDNDELHRGQKSTEVKCVKLSYMATTFDQIYR